MPTVEQQRRHAGTIAEPAILTVDDATLPGGDGTRGDESWLPRRMSSFRCDYLGVSEARSVRGMRSGLSDPDVFRVFYDEALPVVYGYFFKRCGGRREVAADLTQETFLSAVRVVRSGTSVEAPMPWIVTIARRRLVDFYRRKAGRPVPVGDWDTPTVSVGSQWTSGTEARLVSALEQVPTDHRLVLVLRYVDDLAVAEVAELIGRSVRATESLLVRARRSLEAAFEEAEDV